MDGKSSDHTLHSVAATASGGKADGSADECVQIGLPGFDLEHLAEITGWPVARLHAWERSGGITQATPSDWEHADQSLIQAEARLWHGCAGRYCDSAIAVEDADWRYVQHFPVVALLNLMDGGRDGWLAWFKDECLWSLEDGRDGYGELLLEEIDQPVILVELSDGRFDIWDGWHRAAAAVIKGASGIRAIVGTHLGAPTMASSPP